MTSGSTATLVDTNILVYAIDVLDTLDATQTGIVSVQILHEFMSVSTRRIVPPLPMEEAVPVVRYFLRYWPVLPLTPDVTAGALRGVEQHQLSWWDALIWATAQVNGIPTVHSEDFNAGAVLDGVRFVNPFEPAFNLAAV